MNFLTDAFYWITIGLLVPVMVLLLLGFLYSLVSIGSLYGYFSDRKKYRREMEICIQQMEHGGIGEVSFPKVISHHTDMQAALDNAQSHKWNPTRMSKAMGDFEMLADKQLEKTKILMRIGPMLGLMGTLIPMGPALVGLATGDIESMAMNMQVAFSTTVIGVFMGGVGFVIHAVRKRWFTEDFYQLQFIFDLADDEK